MYMCICIYMCVYVCIDIYTHKNFLLNLQEQQVEMFYFQLTQKDFLCFSQNTFVYLYMYICILTVFEGYSMCLLHYI